MFLFFISRNVLYGCSGEAAKCCKELWNDLPAEVGSVKIPAPLASPAEPARIISPEISLSKLESERHRWSPTLVEGKNNTVK